MVSLLQSRHRLRACALSLVVVSASAAVAEEIELLSSENSVRYVELKPTFVTNFGVSDTGHMRYVKADVTVSVASRDAEYATRYHLPALRDKLVLLLARQDESTVSSSMGRETIKAEAIAELREVLETEEGEGFIDDLMFTNFIVQR